jgi:hypothetical protein
VPLGDEGWLDGELVDGDVEGELGRSDGVVDGGGVVTVGGGVVVGEADGVRSPGRSPTRSVRDSPQPAIRVAPAARAMAALSKLFIEGFLPRGIDQGGVVQSGCHAVGAPDTLWRLESPQTAKESPT